MASETTPATSDAIDKQPDRDQESPELIQEAIDMLNSGKRNLACDEIPQAVEVLAQACQLLAAKYGEEAQELGEAYFYYGKALLELARIENGVLGNALDGVTPEEEDETNLSESEQFEKASQVKEEDRDEVRTQVYDAMSELEVEKQENPETSDNKDKEEAMDSEADKQSEDKPMESEKTEVATEEKAEEKAKVKEDNTENKEDNTEEKEESTGKKEDDAEEKSEQEAGTEETKDGEDKEEEEQTEEMESTEEEPGTSSQDEDNEHDGDEVPNLQLSWEVLELAKKIYQPKDDQFSRLKTADIFLTLGEVSVESEQYSQAVQEFNCCLGIQQDILASDDRLLAETHYQLGTAHLLNRDFKPAVEELRLAKSILETRVSNLEKELSQVVDDDSKKEKLQKELNDLKQLLPDMTAKVEDAEDDARNAEKAEGNIKEAIMQHSTTIGFGDSSDSTATPITAKKINDISNLVRKRKPEEQTPEDAKKPKSEMAENGTAGDTSNGQVTNGEAVNGH